jgi:histidinol dehydrogenase
MNVRRFAWEGPGSTARAVRTWTLEAAPEVDVGEIERAVFERGDEALIELTARFDATERPPDALLVPAGEPAKALAGLDSELRGSMELAAENIRAVAEAQVDEAKRVIPLSQGQSVSVREVAVDAAGVYAPGGRAAYPSTVLMCAIPALAAGVERVVLTTPPGPDGVVNPLVLAAAALCEIDEVYAVGGAQAIFALALGTEEVPRVNVIVGPGNAWVREAKRRVAGLVGIDSLAGPSELMVIAGHDADTEWIALDLCAQAEHGEDSPLLVASVEEHVLDAIESATVELAKSRPSVTDAPLALVQVPDLSDAIGLANAYAPEHLELAEDDAALLAGDVKTAGCVFVGRNGATAFGDYVAGSNHVLPTAGAGRYSGPLGPGVFRRKIATVEIPAEAAARLAPHADRIARAEGFPVHGESAMIRAQEKS